MKTAFTKTLLTTLLCVLSLATVTHAEDRKARSVEEAGKLDLKKFLHSIPDTYGWEPDKGTVSYDFFPDGRLHIQGPDGEATMWEGKWQLMGDQLTIINSDKKTKQTVKVTTEGESLLLDGKRYHRARAQE